LPLETAAFITDLVVSNPAHTDGLSQADSHLRLLKSTLKATFPNFTDVALASTQAQLDAAATATAGTTAGAFAAGTAALPGLFVAGSPSTGFFSPAANQIAMSLSGVQALLMGGTAIVTTLSIASSQSIGAAAIASTGAYSGGTGQLVPIGGTLIWFEDSLPAEGGYVWCNGNAISRTGFPILFARWGTRFGAGDGSTSFNVPDLRSTVPVGRPTMGGIGNRSLGIGDTGTNTLFGSATNTLATTNIPPTSSSGVNAITVSPQTIGNNIPVTSGSVGEQQVQFASGGAIVPFRSGGVWGAVTSLGNTIQNIIVTTLGTNSTPVNNVQPSTSCNYILRAA
jgi:microcystin-dependent protein